MVPSAWRLIPKNTIKWSSSIISPAASTDLDYIQGMIREIIDLTVICKTYSRKWNVKYKVKEYLRQTVVRRSL
jgi:hypothetical protein